MALLMTNFYSLSPLATKRPNFVKQILLFRLKHSSRRHTCTCAARFYTTWVRGVACQKRRLGPKFERVWARRAYEKFGTPYLFPQPSELATSNLVQNLGLELAYHKQRLEPKLAGVWAREHPKYWDPLFISATVEASNFKFGTQLGFGTSLPKTTFRTKIGGCLGQGSIQKKL